MKRLLLALALLASTAPAHADKPAEPPHAVANDVALATEPLRPESATEEPEAAPPAWFERHANFLSRAGGRWVADNSAFKSEAEPFDAFGMEWQRGLGGHGLTGRLYGLQDGKEVATFWIFRGFWHPGEGKVQLLQFGGNGIVGIGTIESAGDGKTRSEQTFYPLSGEPFLVGHESADLPAGEGPTGEGPTGEHVTNSFDIAEDGSWKPRRTYTWKRQP